MAFQIHWIENSTTNAVSSFGKPAALNIKHPRYCRYIAISWVKLVLLVGEAILCMICLSSFSVLMVTEGGHIRANRSFDLCVMLYLRRRARPPTVMHSQDATSLEINSLDRSRGCCLETHKHTNGPVMRYMSRSLNKTITIVGRGVKTFCL